MGNKITHATQDFVNGNRLAYDDIIETNDKVTLDFGRGEDSVGALNSISRERIGLSAGQTYHLTFYAYKDGTLKNIYTAQIDASQSDYANNTRVHTGFDFNFDGDVFDENIPLSLEIADSGTSFAALVGCDANSISWESPNYLRLLCLDSGFDRVEVMIGGNFKYRELKPIDDKYIPDTIARKSETIPVLPAGTQIMGFDGGFSDDKKMFALQEGDYFLGGNKLTIKEQGICWARRDVDYMFITFICEAGIKFFDYIYLDDEGEYSTDEPNRELPFANAESILTFSSVEDYSTTFSCMHLMSPSGNAYTVTVDDDGQLITTPHD